MQIMKHHCLLPAIAIVATIAAATSVHAQTPALIPYQGRVQTGTPPADFHGTGQFKFALMQGTTATRLWVNNGPTTADPANAVNLTVTNGLYSVMLGDASNPSMPNMAAIPPSVFANPDVRLRVWFRNGTSPFQLLTPDQRLAPTGYVSSSLSLGNSLANTKIALWEDGGLSYGMGVQDNQFRFHTATANDRFSFLTGPNGTETFTILGDGNVGIGNNDPSTKLHVSQQTATEPTAIFQGGDAENELTPTRSGLAFSYYSNDTSKHFITTTHSVTPSKNRMSFWLNNNTALRTDDTPGVGTTNAMTLTGEGRVGIGTATPLAKSHVRTGTNQNLLVRPGPDFGGSGVGIHSVNDANSANAPLTIGGSSTAIIGGNVGIGDIAPTRAKLVVAGSATSLANNAPNYGYLDPAGAHVNVPVAQLNSIYGEQTIWAGGYIIASSDERIKNIRGRSNAGSDLKTLQSIQVTDYLYKDTVTKGAAPQKKLIAQQVEKVFPMAVSRQTDVVPDIFKKALVKDGWISLKTDLKIGERVRLTDDKTMAIHEVLEVKDDKFRTAFQPKGDEVFVYGREVNDFRTVDYDAIAMLNVSATQELARRLETKDAEMAALQKEHAALQTENAALKAELAAQASKDKSQDEQLAALSALLEKQSSAAATTAGVSTLPAKR